MTTLATVDDFILTFGELESLELSSLENVNEQVINRDKIQNALDLAYEFILGYEALCSNEGSIAILKAIRYLTLNIARYMLDTLKRREDVTNTYQSCIEFLQKAIEGSNGSFSPEELEQYGKTEKRSVHYSRGRRAFEDKELGNFRKDRFYFR